MADDAAVLLVGAGQEPGHVHQVDEGQPKGVAHLDEPGGLVGGVDVQAPAHDHGLVADEAHGPAADPAEAGDDVGGVVGLELKEAVGVRDLADDRAHVVGAAGAVGHDVVEDGAILVAALVLIDGGLVPGAAGQVGEDHPETEVWVLAPPSSSSETFSPVVASMTLGPVMNIWLFWSTMMMRSVRAGL